MDNLSFNIRPNKGLSGFIKSLFATKSAVAKQVQQDSTREYIEAIDEAKKELESAQRLFNNASDPDLIECAIYQEYAAKLRFSYIIKRAKEKNIRFSEYQSL